MNSGRRAAPEVSTRAIAERAQHLENLRAALHKIAPALFVRLRRGGTPNGLQQLDVGQEPTRPVNVADPSEPACQEPYYRWAKSSISIGSVTEPEAAARKVADVAQRSRRV